MKTKLIYPVVLMVVFAAACGGDEGRKSADQAAYETVQEGSASGVTSTIHGPGETLPPITGTNADTTTAFALNPNVVAPGGTPATVAGTLPAPTPVYGGAPAGGGTYTPQQPVTRTTPAASAQPRQAYVPQQQPATSRPAPQPTTSQPQPTQPTQPAAQPEPVEPTETGPTDTATTQPPPASTNTAPPPQAKPKQEQQQNEPAPPPPSEQEEEAEEKPPPPPPPANAR